MAGQASAFTNHKGIVLWLMAVTLVFQILSHVKMWRALHEQEASDDEWCSASKAASARCVEAQLFRSWKHAAKAAAATASVASPGRRGAKLDSIVEDMTTAAPELMSRGDSDDVSSALLMAAFVTPFSTSAPSTTAALGQHAATTLPSLVVGAPAGAKGETTTWSPMTAWARGLVDLQRSFEQRAHELQHARERRAKSLSEKLDEQAARITRSLESAGETEWAKSLRNLQQEFQEQEAQLPSHRAKQAKLSLMDQINAVHRELCEDPRRRERQECVEFLAALAASQEAAADARRVERRAAAMHRETRAGLGARELEEHEATLRAELAHIAEERAVWQRGFDAKVQSTYAELCASRGGVWCTTQQPSTAATEAASPSARPRGAKAEWRANITQEAKRRAEELDAKLAQLAEDRRVWERALLEHYGLSAPAEAEVVSERGTQAEAETSTTPVALWPGVPNLRWPAVAAWKASWTRLRGVRRGVHAEVNRTDLARARWVGALPKVACVTVLPLRHSAKSQVKYVVESFKAQTYEGPKQLVIVYHHEDEGAAEVVKMYADGFFVKGVAAMGPREEFPSATAFRFGAWSADADAIAQWDFDEWHHPQRLALQLRALAFATRPACLMRPPPRSPDPTPPLWEGSLLGEVAWMREHWHPSLAAQHAVLEGAEASNVVALDMREPARRSFVERARLQELHSSVDRTFEGLVAHFEPTSRPVTA